MDFRFSPCFCDIVVKVCFYAPLSVCTDNHIFFEQKEIKKHETHGV